jgi:ATP-dependent Lhr-like helicase
MESRGEIRGGRFVAAFVGEQFALPEALDLLRAVRRKGESAELPEGAGPWAALASATRNVAQSSGLPV